MSKGSPLFTSTGHYTSLCSECANDLLFEYQTRHKDLKIAMIIVCHFLDVYFSEELYESLKDNTNFSLGTYLAKLNGAQYRSKSFTNTLVDLIRDGLRGADDIREERETKWSTSDKRNKNEAINIIGYDPFEGYPEIDRKFLFNELIKYFDEDISEDVYKLSQIIQIVNNNNQIRQCDLIISTLNPITNSNDIDGLNKIKERLVRSNDKIAKENEISVKNRSNKDIGKSTLTYLMKDLREKDFKKAEANYYDQLRSEGTLWAMSMSNRAIQENGMFDENDQQDIFDYQRELIQNLQAQLDDKEEENRLLLVENIELKQKDSGDKNE